MAMMYPEVSPTAPVSREDLAAILAMQGLSGASTNNPGDPGDVAATGRGFGGNAFDGQFGTGAPPANSNPDETGPTPAASFDPGGPMTTANASMVGEDSMGGGKASTVSGFNRGGDDTSQQSQDKQASDRAAIAEAVAGRGGYGLPGGNTFGFGTNQSLADIVADNTTEGIVGFGGPAPGGKGAAVAGLPGSPGSPMSNAFDAANMPNAGALPTGAWDAFAGAPVTSGVPGNRGFGGIPGYGDIPGGIFDAGKGFVSQGWDAVTGGKGGMSGMSENAMNQGIADMIGAALADPGWGGGSGARSGGGAVNTGGGGARSGGAATTGGFNEGAANQGIADMMGAALADPGWGGGANAPGSGGYGPDFSGTGGYSGSGDVGNTSGAGGAVGGFGGGVGGGDGAGVGGVGGVGGGGGGNDSGSDGASGGVG